MPCLINGSRKIPDNHSILSVRVLSFLVGSLCCFLLFFYVSSIGKITSPQDPTINPLESLLLGEGRFSAFNHEEGVQHSPNQKALLPFCCFVFGFCLYFSLFGEKTMKIPSSFQKSLKQSMPIKSPIFRKKKPMKIQSISNKIK